MRFTVALICLTACGSEPTPDTPTTPRETITDSITMPSNELVEGSLIGGPGDRANIELDAPVAKLDWNLHGHADGETQVVMEELGVMSVRFTFEPTALAAWSLLLRNKDAAEMTVQIKIELFGEMTWEAP